MNIIQLLLSGGSTQGVGFKVNGVGRGSGITVWIQGLGFGVRAASRRKTLDTGLWTRTLYFGNAVFQV